MLFEIFVTLWVVLLAFSVYFFVKSLEEALAKGHEQKTEKVATHTRLNAISPRHLIPTGHGKRRPAH